jgi:ATP-dependent RNA helicase HelY
MLVERGAHRVDSRLGIQRIENGFDEDGIGATVEEASRTLPEEDLHVLGYHEFLDGLTRGVAAHHAGLLPAFKQVVEELFQR